ncbi:cation diffusion facilitator family transporter [Clostridium sp. HCP1S3_B4]|uniref:cation diffusion facilitator family transporter n=1 Tax=unclassified Clostridium TaxID=2614128 RepID=UPI003F8C5484
MVTLLTKLFIKNNDLKDPKVRTRYGTICGALGICLNIFLFVFKYFAGVLSGSIAITADAFNNLSDAGSSIVTLIGFKMADKKPDLEHPFGHGRIEYISGFIVSIVIILMGLELFKSSVSKITNPENIDSSIVIILILVISILVKIYMYLYNKKISKKIDSAAMKATALDSLSDSVATLVVLISIFIYKLTGLNIDGISGILVSIFILFSGYNAAKETISPLLGNKPDKEFIDEIIKIVMSHKEITGVHDLIVHDYGPGRVIVSLHAEVPGNSDIFEIHDCIDRIENELNEKLKCESVIHMDPIALDDKKVVFMRKEVAKLVKSFNNRLSIHDFRMVEGTTHNNLIFDVVVPLDLKLDYDYIKNEMEKLIKAKWHDCYAVIKVEKSYI